MKDMVPKGTGNSRFLRSSIPENITYEELVALLRSGKFPVDFAGLNLEGIATQGSAYNKANVLPDGVCTSLGIPTSSEPKDAFGKLLAKGQKKEIARITSSKSWTCPSDVNSIHVFMCGGGSGGGAGSSKTSDSHFSAGGGGAGGFACVLIDLPVTPGKSYPIVIGSGGAGGNSSSPDGKSGGTTSAFGFSVKGALTGGKGKKRSVTFGGAKGGTGGNPGGFGGQMTSSSYNRDLKGDPGAYGGYGTINPTESDYAFYEKILFPIGGTGNYVNDGSYAPFPVVGNPFEEKGYRYCAGGGGGAGYNPETDTSGTPGTSIGGGNGGSVGSPGSNATENTGSGGGGGGGSKNSSLTNGGKGANGVVIIYA